MSKIAAEEFRMYALECDRLAVQMKNPQLKGLAFELAATWLKLAAEVEKRIKTPPEQPDLANITLG
jgi:hypothetical protein